MSAYGDWRIVSYKLYWRKYIVAVIIYGYIDKWKLNFIRLTVIKRHGTLKSRELSRVKESILVSTNLKYWEYHYLANVSCILKMAEGNLENSETLAIVGVEEIC